MWVWVLVLGGEFLWSCATFYQFGVDKIKREDYITDYARIREVTAG